MAATALIVGAGSGISASVARALARAGYAVVLAARDTAKLDGLKAETGGRAIACDAADPASVAALFEEMDADAGSLDVAVYNPSLRFKGPLVDLDPGEVRDALMVTAFGAFLVAQQAARRMLKQGHGAIVFTGASAGVKGYPQSAPFAMGKFALRGLAQSMARELHPKNIHVAHVVIDGGVRNTTRGMADAEGEDRFLDPDAIAETYLQLIGQHRSAWAWEIELRPWVETF